METNWLVVICFVGFGDAHVRTDLIRANRSSLADALRTSECGGDRGGPPFHWDIAIDIGDMSGGQDVPDDEEGREVVRQFSVLERHRREDVYSICGNHDRSGLSQAAGLVVAEVELNPMGMHTVHSGVDASRRPYSTTGTWERFSSFTVGNVLFLLAGDINEPSQTVGRGTLGGNPAGVLTGETFAWWREQVETHPDHIVVPAHHYMLKNTTVASGDWEGKARRRRSLAESLPWL